jgi:uncharacterized protein YraI
MLGNLQANFFEGMMAFTQGIRTTLFSALFSAGTLLALGQTTADSGQRARADLNPRSGSGNSFAAA